MTPQVRVAKRLYPDGLTTQEFAKAVRRSISTVERWRRVGILRPSREVDTGETMVYLYSPEDVVAGKQLRKTLRPGRAAADAHA